MRKFPEAHDAIWDEVTKITWMSVSHIKAGLNEEFGPDFCKKHPDVFASVVNSTMTAYGSALIAAAIQDSKK